MNQWNGDELARIGSADELEVAAFRRDGSVRDPVTIWVVPYEGDIYVRSVNGRSAAWFRATQGMHRGRIRAGSIEREVTFVEPDRDLGDELDAAYRAKYRRYAASIVSSIVSPAARSATIKLVPL